MGLLSRIGLISLVGHARSLKARPRAHGGALGSAAVGCTFAAQDTRLMPGTSIRWPSLPVARAASASFQGRRSIARSSSMPDVSLRHEDRYFELLPVLWTRSLS